MGKNNNNKNNKDNKEKPDLVDFLFDNYDNLKKNSSMIMKYLKEMWIVLPDIIGNVVNFLLSFLDRFFMRIRSYYALQINNDLERLEKDKYLWAFLDQLKKSNKLTSFIKKCKNKSINKKSNDYLSLVMYYVNKDLKDKFLSCFISQQNNKDFNRIRELLIAKMHNYGNINKEILNEKETKQVTNAFTNTIESSDSKSDKSDSEDEMYNRDIFTSDKIESNINDNNINDNNINDNNINSNNKKTKNTLKYKPITESESDTHSAADNYRKKFYGIKK